jgi:hypothetical protein
MSRDFLNFMEANDFTQIIDFPTHSKGNILDLVLSNCLSTPKVIFTDPGYSDHTAIGISLPLFLKIQKSKQPQEYKELILFSKMDPDEIYSILNPVADKIEIMIEQEKSHINIVWTYFKYELFKAVNTIPKKIIKHTKKKWISKKTIQLIRKKRRIYHKHLKHQDEQSSQELKNINKLVKNSINADYHNHLKTRISDQLKAGNSKPLYKFISKRRKDPAHTIHKLDGCAEGDFKAIAEKLANAFCDVFTVDNNIYPKMPSLDAPTSPEIVFEPAGIESLIKNLDQRKSPGPDSISPLLLKSFLPFILTPLTLIFQYSYNSGQVPDDWKRANVVPIHKKGPTQCPSNYRPISLTSIVSKIIEHVINHNIREHLDNHNLLTDLQHGFRKHYSCESQLLTTLFDFVTNANDNLQTDVLALDFSKAFDTVSHNKLIDKLDHYKLHKNTINWIKNWLDNRHMCVTVGRHKSTPKLVTSGVPQGSVLGPLLFLIFINDLPSVLSNSTVRLYADDALIYKQIRNRTDSQLLQEDLANLVRWTKNNQLNLNINKCLSISLSPVKLHSSYTVMGSPLQQVDTHWASLPPPRISHVSVRWFHH